ncbi:MAG: DUF971 domain-containing protein [Cellvibrionales bacterium]|jgi:DUF971 family protein
MSRTSTPPPTTLHYSRSKRELHVAFEDGVEGTLPAEFLRVLSPSAEVRGHGPGQEVLQAGKALVGISAIHPVGHYAVQLDFDDGHDSGIYSWELLRDFVLRKTVLWQDYLQRLTASGLSRDPDIQVLTFQP